MPLYASLTILFSEHGCLSPMIPPNPTNVTEKKDSGPLNNVGVRGTDIENLHVTFDSPKPELLIDNC